MSRFVRTTLIAVLGAVLLPWAAGASDSDVEAQLKAMQQRMSQLEDKLQSTTDQLDQANERLGVQESLIQRAAIDQEASSGIASFLDTLEIGGWIAGSYNFNFRDPNPGNFAGFNTGSAGLFPFQPDTNSFQVDQVWFSLARPTSEENRAGFGMDLVMGKTAQILNGVGVIGKTAQIRNGNPSGNFTQFHLQTAWIEYLMPVGERNVKFEAGKMETWIGAEVVEAPQNFNITRGDVWQLMQPITNVGIRASMDFGEGFDAGLGFVNGTRTAEDVDLNKNKAVVAKLGWSNDVFGAQVAGTYGDAAESQGITGLPAGDKETILDVILSWDPNESFSGYINYDYLNSDCSANTVNGFPGTAVCGNSNGVNGDRLRGHGVSVAGRYAVNDRTGVALRGEYLDLDSGTSNNFRVYSITGTLDYHLTNNLLVKAEGRFDQAENKNGTVFTDGNGNANDNNDQIVTAVQVIYSF